MNLPSIVTSHISVDLKPMPIEPSWIREGKPIARAAELWQSPDGRACTLVWDCTPGKFVWDYTSEETIHILQGSIVLDDGNGPPRRYGVGDVVYFPLGTKVHWHVVEHVRKLAFFRHQLPKPVRIILEGLRQVKTVGRGSKGPQGVG